MSNPSIHEFYHGVLILFEVFWGLFLWIVGEWKVQSRKFTGNKGIESLARVQKDPQEKLTSA